MLTGRIIYLITITLFVLLIQGCKEETQKMGIVDSSSQVSDSIKIVPILQELNIEDSVNEHYVSEYNLEFSSLVIARYSEGRKDKWKNLEETWKLVNDKDSFKKYVKFELNQFIKNN